MVGMCRSCQGKGRRLKRLFVHATILTMKEGEKPLADAALAVEDDRIAYVGPVPSETDGYDEVVNMAGRAILPGFVNTHGHAAMSLLRGYADDDPLKTWLEEKIWPMEARFGPEQVRWGSALSVLEMIKGGSTRFLDMYDHMDQVGQVVEEAELAPFCAGEPSAFVPRRNVGPSWKRRSGSPASGTGRRREGSQR